MTVALAAVAFLLLLRCLTLEARIRQRDARISKLRFERRP